MGQKNSILNISNISKETLNCDSNCMKSKKRNQLVNLKNKLTIGKNTITEELNKVTQQIQENSYDKSQLDKIKYSSNVKIIDNDISRYDKLYKQLHDELETRISLFITQFKFFTKNNVVLNDLESKSKKEESVLRKKKAEFNKIDREINNIKTDTDIQINKLNYLYFFIKIIILLLTIFIIGIAIKFYLLKKKGEDILVIFKNLFSIKGNILENGL